ncbi:MAG: hypothetical protein ACJ796_08030 [Gemmatimonadaceae bacterium]
MSFETVFDVTRAGFRAWWAFVPFVGVAAIGFVASAIGVGAVRRMGKLCALAAILFAIIAEYGAYRDYCGLRLAVEQQRFTSVEGTVVDFVPGGSDGHPPERFCVGGHCYSYSPAMISADFNRVSGRGGPIRAGQTVRIADVGGRIARLEIERGGTNRQ